MKRALIAMVFLAAFDMTPAAAASFDCNKAQSPDELAICSTPDLSSLESAMAAGYHQALKKADDKEQVKTVARNALAARQACQWHGKCIFDVMSNALNQYKVVLAGAPAGDKLNYGSKAGCRFPSLAGAASVLPTPSSGQGTPSRSRK